MVTLQPKGRELSELLSGELGNLVAVKLCLIDEICIEGIVLLKED
jgi:hypothetical protein